MTNLLWEKCQTDWSKSSGGRSDNFLEVGVVDGPHVGHVTVFTEGPVVNPKTNMTTVSEIDRSCALQSGEVDFSSKKVWNSS